MNFRHRHRQVPPPVQAKKLELSALFAIFLVYSLTFGGGTQRNLATCAPVQIVSSGFPELTLLWAQSEVAAQQNQGDLSGQILIRSTGGGSSADEELEEDEEDEQQQQSAARDSTRAAATNEKMATNETTTTNTTTIASLTTTTTTASSTSTISLLVGGGTRSRQAARVIRLPNGQSVQFCDEQDAELKCDDENSVCKLGACVCKSGYFLNRQSSLCQSIDNLFENCENDLQCQAFDVNLICDLKPNERRVCDCAPGLYLDSETRLCLPCHRIPFMVPMSGPVQQQQVNQSDELTTSDSSTLHEAVLNMNKVTNSTASAAAAAAAASILAAAAAIAAEPSWSSAPTATMVQFQPCRPIDMAKLNAIRRKHKLMAIESDLVGVAAAAAAAQSHGWSPQQTPSASSSTPTANSNSNNNNSADPLRIKTPLEVFMGAIMLFTLFTVAWFFLQRMVHDCRTILRSLRNNADMMLPTTIGDQNFVAGNFTSASTATTNSVLGSTPVARQAGAADASLIDGDYIETMPGFLTRRSNGGLGYVVPFGSAYQRAIVDLMNRHLSGGGASGGSSDLTTSLSPSSTNHALATITNGSSMRSSTITQLASAAANAEEAAALYPLGAYHHSTNQAANAAAQLLLSNRQLGQNHPAIAILRAAAATAPHDQAGYGGFLSSVFDPPPKYEEAIAQSTGNQPSYLPPSLSSPFPPSPPPPPPVLNLPLVQQAVGQTNSTASSSLSSPRDDQQQFDRSQSQQLEDSNVNSTSPASANDDNRLLEADPQRNRRGSENTTSHLRSNSTISSLDS